jgi:hypothetical protein
MSTIQVPKMMNNDSTKKLSKRKLKKPNRYSKKKDIKNDKSRNFRSEMKKYNETEWVPVQKIEPKLPVPRTK